MPKIATDARIRTYTVSWSDERNGWTARQHTRVQIIDGYSDLASIPKIIATAHLEGRGRLRA